MKRITPSEVIDAYIATGMYPVFGQWGTRDGNGGCGLSAIGKTQKCFPISGSRAVKIADGLGLTVSYAVGFSFGFDGEDFEIICQESHWALPGRPAICNEGYCQGQKDGRAARAAVKAHFAKAANKATAEALPELAEAL